MSNVHQSQLSYFVRAGWTAILAFAALAVFQYVIYMYVMATRPDALLHLMGPNVSWDELSHLWLLMMVAIKVVLWVFLTANLWLWLFLRALRKAT